LKNKVLKQPVNCQMIKPTPKPQDVYYNKKNNELEIEWKIKIPFFTLNCSSINMWTWIFAQSMWFQKNIFRNEKTK
jgi:hypothetical protein